MKNYSPEYCLPLIWTSALGTESTIIDIVFQCVYVCRGGVGDTFVDDNYMSVYGRKGKKNKQNNIQSSSSSSSSSSTPQHLAQTGLPSKA